MKRAAALLPALLLACAEPPVVLRGATMGTTYTVKYVGEGAPDEVHRAVEECLAEVNRLFSTYDPQSEISRFNDHRSTEPFAASAPFAEMVRIALELATRTGGAFDPTVLPVLELYGFGAAGERRVPGDDEIEAALLLVGHHRLRALGGDRLQKEIPDLRIDLSAIAKGGGVDRVAELLAARGIGSFMVEIGGEVRCAGAKADGSAWTIGIEGPGGSGGGVEIVEKERLRDRALATSGSYRNFIRSGATEVHHVLDPRTGRNPRNGVVSVSVLAPTCTVADTLATALMVTGPERAEEVLAGLEGVGALFVLRDGERGVHVQRVRW